MTISLVPGGALATGAINGGDATITLPAMVEGDVVYLFGMLSNAGGPAPTTPAGFTSLSSVAGSGSAVFRRVMTATPDTSVTIAGSGSSLDSTGAAVFCLRGVDSTTPEDATTTKSALTSSTNPDPPSITTATANAWVLVFAESSVSDAAVTIPAGYSNGLADNRSDTHSLTIGGATKLVATVGVENPASWTNWVTGTWATYTVAVRPRDIVSADASQTIPSFAQVATVTSTAKAQASQTMPALAQTATVTSTVKAGAAQTIPSFAQSATATSTIKATAAQTVPAFAQAATASVIVKAGAAQTIPDFAQVATVSTDTTIHAVAAQTVPAFGQAATVGVIGEAQAAQTIPAFAQLATMVAPAQASAAQQVPDFGQAAAVISIVRASAAQTIEAFTQVFNGITRVRSRVASSHRAIVDPTLHIAIVDPTLHVALVDSTFHRVDVPADLAVGTLEN